MLTMSPRDEPEFVTLEVIVLGIVEEHLKRNGGACLLSVKTVAKTMHRRFGTEKSKALNTEIDTILEPLYRFWGYTSTNNRRIVDGVQIKAPGISTRLYELRRAS